MTLSGGRFLALFKLDVSTNGASQMLDTALENEYKRYAHTPEFYQIPEFLLYTSIILFVDPT